MQSHTPADACPKCGGQMEAGVLVDKGPDATESEPVWIKGKPGRGFFTGAFKAGAQERLAVRSVRCARCGYIELYAR